MNSELNNDMITLQNWIYIQNSDRFERFICFRCTSDSTKYKKALVTKRNSDSFYRSYLIYNNFRKRDVLLAKEKTLELALIKTDLLLTKMGFKLDKVFGWVMKNLPKLDLHGVKHGDVISICEKFINKNFGKEFVIITGNSKKMKELVLLSLKPYDLRYRVGNITIGKK